MNYDAGKSEERGDGGLYYTATGKKSWSHDDVYEVYAQNPALEQVVGTREEPTWHIFDCTPQGTLGRDGESGEATGERQADRSRYTCSYSGFDHRRDAGATKRNANCGRSARKCTGNMRPRGTHTGFDGGGDP